MTDENDAMRAAHVRAQKVYGALMMGLQIAESGNHDGTNAACPTCEFVNRARDALAHVSGTERNVQ